MNLFSYFSRLRERHRAAEAARLEKEAAEEAARMLRRQEALAEELEDCRRIAGKAQSRFEALGAEFTTWSSQVNRHRQTIIAYFTLPTGGLFLVTVESDGCYVQAVSKP